MPSSSHKGSPERPEVGAERIVLLAPTRTGGKHTLKRLVFTDAGWTTFYDEAAKDWIHWSGSWKDLETLGRFASPDEARDFLIARSEASGA